MREEINSSTNKDSLGGTFIKEKDEQLAVKFKFEVEMVKNTRVYEELQNTCQEVMPVSNEQNKEEVDIQNFHLLQG